MPTISIFLPPREGFSPTHFGAIALCVRDFVEYSRYRQQCTVIGGVETATPFPNSRYLALSGKEHRLQTRSYAYARAALKYLRQHQPALAEVHNRPNLAKYLCRHWDGKIALHLHNDPQDMKKAHSVREREWLLKRLAAVYCVSGYIRDRFIQGLKGDTRKVHVVYNGIQLERPEELPPKQKQILFVGRLKPEKGALEFAEALKIALPQFPDWQGVFIGATRHHPDAPVEPYERRIHTVLESLGDQVEMRGFCNHEQTMQATQESLIAVIPSTWHEAFGRTALEAMASGCITISSTMGGLKEVVGKAAILLERIDGETIARAVGQAIQTPEKWPEWQQQALTQSQKFDIERATATLDDVRKKLVNQEGA